MEKLTKETRAVVGNAEGNARALKHHYVGTEHLLLGLLVLPGQPREVLEGLGVNAEAVHREIVRIVDRGRRGPNQHARLPLTRGARAALARALREAVSLGYGEIRPEHLLLGLVRCNKDAMAMRILRDFGVDDEMVVNAVIHAISRRPAQAVVDEPPKRLREAQESSPLLRRLRAAARYSDGVGWGGVITHGATPREQQRLHGYVTISGPWVTVDYGAWDHQADGVDATRRTLPASRVLEIVWDDVEDGE